LRWAIAVEFQRVMKSPTPAPRIVVTAVASYSALPEPMLARSGRLLTSGDYAYDVKWDGFRAIVSTEGGVCVRPVVAAGAPDAMG
jgi:hypothetical protein